MRTRVLRIELERAAVGRHRVGGPAQFPVQIAEVVVRRCGARIEGKRLLVARQRRLRIAGVEQRVAEVDFRVEEFGVERDRAAQARDRVREAAVLPARDAQQILRDGRSRMREGRVLGGLQRHLRTARRQREHAVPAQRVVVIGLCAEHRLEQRCRFRQAALVLCADRRGDHVVWVAGSQAVAVSRGDCRPWRRR